MREKQQHWISDRTTVAIFPEFLEYMQQVAQNCNQQLASGIKALLPSCFVAKPESSSKNVNQLMQNISDLVERGVQVALPTDSPTPSCNQSIDFAIAMNSCCPSIHRCQTLAITLILAMDKLTLARRVITETKIAL